MTILITQINLYSNNFFIAINFKLLFIANKSGQIKVNKNNIK
jgi:hypothetical protein